MHDSINIKGTKLQECSVEPLTGWFRDGCCNTDERDQGSHTVCAIVTDEFLEFALSQGNDLITPAPQFGFPGLKSENRWTITKERRSHILCPRISWFLPNAFLSCPAKQ